MKAALVSLGCAKNLVDSEIVLSVLERGGISLTSDLKEADLVILNTCAFIKPAREEAAREIKSIRKKTKARIAVMGCFPEKDLEECRSMLPEADLLIPIHDYPRFGKILGDFLGISELPAMEPTKRVISTPPWSAWLRISEGCDNHCAFCAIPKIRGSFRSRPYEEILEEARSLREQGVIELSVVSQDTCRYGKDLGAGAKTLVDLLRELDGMGFYSIRLFYLYPAEVTDELLDLIAGSKSIAHYLDLPIQCASDPLLRRMNRRDTVEGMRDLFRRIQEKIPDAVYRTTLITGFPGETEEDHRSTLEFMKEIRFHHLGCFRFSPEEGTPAYKMDGEVPEDVVRARERDIMGLQLQIAAERCREMVDKDLEGIVTGYDAHRHQYTFRSYWNAPDEIDANIYFSSPITVPSGSIRKLKVTNGFVRDLAGQLLPEE